jgi:hypothetical protein
VAFKSDGKGRYAVTDRNTARKRRPPRKREWKKGNFMRDLRTRILYASCIGAAALALLNCSSTPPGAERDERATDALVADGVEYVDCEKIAGVPGLLPKDDSLSPMQQIGRCTWVLSTGRTSDNPNFRVDARGNPTDTPAGRDGTENLVGAIAKKNGGYMPLLATLAAKSEADRVARWTKYGVMNDPGCKASDREDEYGLQLDTCVDPYSAGAVGLRKFENPKFDAAARALDEGQGKRA